MAETARTSTFMGNALPYARADAELADLAPDSVVLLDLAGTIQYWNPASERLYGWPAIGALRRNVQELSANAAANIEHWYTLLQHGSWEGLIRRRTPWGGHVTSFVRQVVRCDGDGQPHDVVEFGKSARSESEGQLAREPELPSLAAAGWELDISEVRPLLDSIAARRGRKAPIDLTSQPELIDELLTGIRVADVNERAVQLVGSFTDRAGMVGQPVHNFWPSVGRDVLAEMIIVVATDGSRGATRMRKIARRGVLHNPIITVWRSEAPDRSDTLFVAVNGSADDDRSFWYLRASEERYRKLIYHLPSALLQVDASLMGHVFGELKANGVTDLDAYLDEHPDLIDYANDAVRVTEVNREAVALFGGNAPADFIRSVGFLFEASPESARRVMAARFQGRRNHSEIMKVKTFDGRLLDVRLSVTYPAPPERLDITLLYLEDVTERLRTERQLRQLEADFTHSARISMIGELAASIAHEVNQPLSAIVTNGETSLRWLSRADPNLAKVTDLTTRIVSNARRASDVVQHIRGMAANHEPARVPVDLNAVIEEALLFLRHDIDSKSITLSAKLAAELPDVIADRVQLQQVVVNLLVNGIQAIAQSQQAVRRIELETRRDEEAVTFSIRDTGPGIEAENIDRIFESFFTTKESGVGIGLAICQSIVMAHGGNLTAANHPDGGALFSFCLPIKRS